MFFIIWSQCLTESLVGHSTLLFNKTINVQFLQISLQKYSYLKLNSILFGKKQPQNINSNSFFFLLKAVSLFERDILCPFTNNFYSRWQLKLDILHCHLKIIRANKIFHWKKKGFSEWSGNLFYCIFYVNYMVKFKLKYYKLKDNITYSRPKCTNEPPSVIGSLSKIFLYPLYSIIFHYIGYNIRKLKKGSLNIAKITIGN